jgi:hypothetical protein
LAEVFGGGASFRVDNTQAYRFYGTSLSEYEGVSGDREDALDRWAQERERRLDNSASARYVPAGVVGFEDLDANGRWVVDDNYGNVWLPSRVDAGWTPYRDGRWTWVGSWGWTWIDNAPWGYAVSRYGRWAYLGNSWAWVPGATHERVAYAPALVVFVGNDQGRTLPRRREGMGNTAWFPLGPHEVYRPEHMPKREGYVNQHVQGAIVAANQTPSARAPSAEAFNRPPRDNHPAMATRIAPAPAASAFGTPAKSTNPKGDFTRNDAARVERMRNETARRDPPNPPAARFEHGNREAARTANVQADNAIAARTEAAKEPAANAIRADQGKHRGRDADAQRGNAQRLDRKLTPEEELLLRGQRK